MSQQPTAICYVQHPQQATYLITA